MARERCSVEICLSLVAVIFALAFFPYPGNARVRQETVSSDPESYLPAGEGKELLKALCTTCHDLGRVVPRRLDKEAWRKTVSGMLTAWDPQYSLHLGDEVELLVKYLATYFGLFSPAYETMKIDSSLREKYLRGEIKSLININTASAAELLKLPGISKEAAERIVEYRKSQGSFKSSQEFKTVSGMGEKEFERLGDLLTLGQSSPEAVDAASKK